MMKELLKLGGVVATMLCVQACTSVATAPEGRVELRVRQEIEAMLRAQEAANVAGDSGEQLARRLYAPDVAVSGEGEPRVALGMAKAAEATEGWRQSLGPDGQKHCRFELKDPFVASETVAASYIILRCKANPPTLPEDSVTRMLYVWKRLPEGWRVALEVWGAGDF